MYKPVFIKHNVFTAITFETLYEDTYYTFVYSFFLSDVNTVPVDQCMHAENHLFVYEQSSKLYMQVELDSLLTNEDEETSLSLYFYSLSTYEYSLSSFLETSTKL